MNYVYVGPGPHEDAAIGLVRPGDVRDFEEEPAWGPWQRLGEALMEASAPVLAAIGAKLPEGVPKPHPASVPVLAPPATGKEGM